MSRTAFGRTIFFVSLQCLLFCWITSLDAQQQVPDRQQLRPVTATEDTAKVNRLIERSSSLRNSDTDSAEFYASEALELAKAIKFTPGIIRAMNGVAYILNRKGMPNRAMAQYLRARSLAVNTANLPGLARSLGGIGLIYLDRGRYATARLYFDSSLVLSEQIGDRSSVATYLSNIGATCMQQGRHGKAVDYFRRSLRLFTETDDTRGIALCTGNLGIIAHYQGNHIHALKYFRESMRLSERMGDRRRAANSRANIGLILGILGRFDKAAAETEEALRLYEELRDSEGRARCLMNLGANYQNLGDYPRALECFRKSLSLYEEMNNKSGAASCLKNIGVIYGKLDGFCNQSVAHYRQSLDIFRTLGDTREIIQVLRLLGAALNCQGNHEQALDCFEECQELAENIGAKSWIARALDGRGATYVERGEYEKAIRLFERSLKLKESMSERADLAGNLCVLGGTYYLAGDGTRALEYLHRGLSIAEELHASETITGALKRLHNVYANRGDFKHAYQYYRRLTRHRDTIRTNEARRELRELMQGYEVEKRERAIEMLEKDKKLQSLELLRRDDALRRSRLEALQRSQEVELLSRAAEIHQLEMAMTEANLRSREADAERTQQRIMLLEKDKKLQAASLEQETLLRNGALLGTILILVLGALQVRHLRQRRRVSELRARVAESRARDAEVQALRVQAEAERKETEIQRMFSHRLMDSQERERSRIARDLHDSLGQKLAVIRSRTQLALTSDREVQDPRQLISELSDTTHDILQEIRMISHNLHPPVLDTFGLAKALEDMTRELEPVSETEWDLSITADMDGLEPARQLTLYRVLQEAASNVIRHAGAVYASIRIARHEERLHIAVEDDGHGFDVEGSGSVAEGLGLRSMRERVRMLGGTLTIISRENIGTKLLIDIPESTEYDARDSAADETMTTGVSS